VFAFASSIWLLDAARFGQGIGAALAWTGALSWLVMEGSRERRGELIGIATVVGTRPTFASAALPAVALGGACFLVPGPDKRFPQPASSLLTAIRRPRLVVGLWLMTLASLALGTLDVLA